MKHHSSLQGWILPSIGLLILMLSPGLIFAHCDTEDGPIIPEVRQALAKGDITPVLKWIMPEAEPEVLAAFQHALEVRKLGPKAQELADQYFLETLIRVHRAGEGASFTGIKPGGATDPAVLMADQSLVTGSVDEMTGKLAAHMTSTIKERFTKAMEAKKHAGESVTAGREYVEAYISYVHFVERLHLDMAAPAGHHSEAEETPNSAPHNH